ncbi:MAG: hypothetical protein OXH15_01050 [Gammaproteobacteria bacterium]|nr:hypothetical protein [Gammaproteobacteria bacterium]
MKRFTAFTCLAALMPVAACATTVTETNYRSVDADDYRISVEIPLDGTEFEDEQILRVNELLDERTEFDSSDFQLDEVVLVARSDGAADPDVAGQAELLVLEWRSGVFDIPPGSEGDWYEVRIPAPDEDPGGAWLLDVTGDVTVDFLVVVMEPRPRVVAEKTVYRTRTVYRTIDGRRHAYPSYWIYDPTRYYVYHYYDDLWPYRYFTGVWDFRYYHVGFRPHYHRFGIYHGPHYDTVVWRDRYRSDRRRYRHGRDAVAWKLHGASDARPRYDALKRSNVRLRTFHNRNSAPATAAETPVVGRDSARERYEQAKRTHPRLRQFHRNRGSATNAPQEDARPASGLNRAGSDRVRSSSASQRGPATATRQAAPRAATAPPSRGLGNDYGASRHNSARQSAAGPSRIPTLRGSASPSRPAAGRSAHTRAAPQRAQAPRRAVSPRANQGATRRAAAPVPRAAAPQPRAAPSSSGNVRSRTFQRRAAAPAPTVSRPARTSAPRSFERAAPSRPAPVRSAPPVRHSAPATQSSSSNPRSRSMSRR